MNFKIIALSIALALTTPFVAANTFDSTMAVADTVFVEIDAEDPDLAALAGLATYKVQWFSGATLFSRVLDDAEGHVIVVKDGVDDPRGRTFSATGETWDITDPVNGAITWTTTEYTFTDDSAATQYAYVVTVGTQITEAIDIDGAAGGDIYNFIAMVDTSVLNGGSLGSGGSDGQTFGVDVFVDDGAIATA